ncbi:MAG: hypothetical protein CENE_01656 [Candidatus Celerinatantimonas neptuna]|nr:MAG: hypothetical protein CENE_01656 [Candidatus Celerinatantimonas neptuna]
MQYYLIQPRDPLIIRSGRPFEEISDAQAARFPPPSTVAGALRNMYARSNGLPLDEALLKLAVRGPLAVKLGPKGKDCILVPKPADAQYFADPTTGNPQLIRMVPMKPASGEGCDLPKEALYPLFPEQSFKGKPVPGPNWWALDDLITWRKGTESLDFKSVQENSWTPVGPDIRTHIAMDNQRRASVSGQIFQTTGLCMWQKPTDKARFPDTSIGILGGIEGEITQPGLVHLGGERRLAQVKPCDLWPKMPKERLTSTAKVNGLIITFLTPTIFENGWLPGWLSDEQTLIGQLPGTDVTVQLRAAALDRWIPQSGWDLKNRQPRAAQKMIPAGATYWFECIGQSVTADVMQSLWMRNLCDDKQTNRNGFGLALPAPWMIDDSHTI